MDETVRTDLHFVSGREGMDQLKPNSLIPNHFMCGKEWHRDIGIGCGRLCLISPNHRRYQYLSAAMVQQHTQRVLLWDTSMGLVELQEVDQRMDRLW